MSIELLKIVVQPVALERDERGAVVGERVGEAVALYTIEQIEQYVEQLRATLAAPENGGVAARD